MRRENEKETQEDENEQIKIVKKVKWKEKPNRNQFIVSMEIQRSEAHTISLPRKSKTPIHGNPGNSRKVKEKTLRRSVDRPENCLRYFLFTNLKEKIEKKE